MSLILFQLIKLTSTTSFAHLAPQFVLLAAIDGVLELFASQVAPMSPYMTRLSQ